MLGGGAVALALALLWGRSRPPGGAEAEGDVDAEMDARIDRELAVEE